MSVKEVGLMHRSIELISNVCNGHTTLDMTPALLRRADRISLNVILHVSCGRKAIPGISLLHFARCTRRNYTQQDADITFADF